MRIKKRSEKRDIWNGGTKRRISEVMIGKRKSTKRKKVKKGKARCEESRRNMVNVERKYRGKATYKKTKLIKEEEII